LSTQRQTHIADLQPNRRGLVIDFKVLKTEAPRTVTNRSDGSSHRVADVLVGDSTGCVLLTLWDNDIALAQVGSILRMTSGQTGFFQGRLRLSLGRGGALQPSTTSITEVNTERNLSIAVHPAQEASRGRGRPGDDRGPPIRRTKGFKWSRI
jgi:replication factor A1